MGPIEGSRCSGARHVRARARVDLDLVADVHEQRDVHGRARLERRRLVAAPGGGVALHAGLGVGDLELDGSRELEVRGLVVDEQQVDGLARLDPLEGALDARLRDRELLVRALVHEVRVRAVGVEELHLARLGPDRPELLSGPERPVDHRTVGRPTELRADERAALAGLDVLELEDLEDRALDLDVVAVLELVRGDRENQPLRRTFRMWSTNAPRVWLS